VRNADAWLTRSQKKKRIRRRKRQKAAAATVVVEATATTTTATATAFASISFQELLRGKVRAAVRVASAGHAESGFAARLRARPVEHSLHEIGDCADFEFMLCSLSPVSVRMAAQTKVPVDVV
jgi:hypothetical protein